MANQAQALAAHAASVAGDNSPAVQSRYPIGWELLLYNLVLALTWPALVTFYLARMITRGTLGRDWAQRLGLISDPALRGPSTHDRLWIHAVSAGETVAAAPMLRALLEVCPQAELVISNTTPAGHQQAARLCPQALARIYFPLDFLPCAAAALRKIKPRACLQVEGELWPNFFALAKRRGASVVIVNGRVSEANLHASWPLRAMWRWLIRQPDWLCLQTDADARRAVALGADHARITVVGNTKFDQPVAAASQDQCAQLARELGINSGEPIVVAGSTHPGEEQAVLEAFRQVRERYRSARLLLAPRHIERTAAVERLVLAHGFTCVRRSAGRAGDAEVVLLDTMGELAAAYSLGTIAFVGGSLAPIGGHSLLEPLAAGKPVMFGPHMHKSQDIAGLVLEADLGRQVADARELAQAMLDYLNDDQWRAAFPGRSQAWFQRQRGASRRCAEVVARLLAVAPIRPASQVRPVGPTQYLIEVVRGERRDAMAAAIRGGLGALSLLYRAGVWSYRALCRWGVLRVTRLPATVVSVGNLTLGGTGKTSASIALARSLLADGRRVAVLIRGRGKQGLVSDGTRLLLSPGEAGDEPVLLACWLRGVPVLVGKDRRLSGRRAIEQFGAQAIVLDDGFQYWRLHKDREVVLVDALDPFGGGQLLPRGWLREPVSALRRAQAIWITHTDLVEEHTLTELKQRLSRLCPGQEITETCHWPVGLVKWSDHAARSLDDIRGRRVCALSSIGNPISFEQTLLSLGAAQVVPVRFPDHHRYGPQDLDQVRQVLAEGAEVAVTTAKDAVRLPEAARDLPLWILEVELRQRNGRALGIEEIGLTPRAETERP